LAVYRAAVVPVVALAPTQQQWWLVGVMVELKNLGVAGACSIPPMLPTRKLKTAVRTFEAD
jgi:hypothetical protein